MTDHTVVGPVKAENIAKLKAHINALEVAGKTHADKVEVAAWSRLLDEYIRGQFHWEDIFPKAIVR